MTVDAIYTLQVLCKHVQQSSTAMQSMPLLETVFDEGACKVKVFLHEPLIGKTRMWIGRA